MKDTVIIPTYNEKENVVALIPQIFSIIPDISIAVVDDNSPDGTAEAVISLMEKYPKLSIIKRPSKDGLGKAYRFAFKKILEDASTRSVIIMDADLSHNPRIIPEMILQSHDFDVIIGSRYIEGGGTVGWEAWRKGLSFFANIYCRLVTGLPIRDCTSGFILIKVDLLRKIDLNAMDASGYAFLIELKFMLWKAGATLKEIPIVFKNRIGGESKISSHIITEGIIAPWRMRLGGR